MKTMGTVISFGIQKGGCGKTTCTGMVATLLSREGHKVLAVDFDSQGNLTQFLAQCDPYEFTGKTVFQACKERNPKPYIVELTDTLHLLPAEDFLSKYGAWLFTEYVTILKGEGVDDKYALSKNLKETLDVVKDEYDYILIDLPPNLGEQTVNGMVASDCAIAVLQSEPFCKSALDRYLDTLEHSMEKVNPETTLLGILTSLIDPRHSMAQHVLSETKEEYGEVVFNTIIERKTRIVEYSFAGIADLRRKEDRVAQAMYMNLIKEIKERIG
jgi:chromosome partitioning protein